jgi:predicted nucleotidyltransferase
MKKCGLNSRELELMRAVFCHFPQIEKVILFGSRAKNTHRPESDVDLALMEMGNILQVSAVAEALDELPLPYKFDVLAYNQINYAPLQAHIDRVGIPIYQRNENIP